MNRTILAFMAVALMACANNRPVAVAPAPSPAPASVLAEDPASELAQYGYDAVLWQHASAEAYRLQQQGYELARIRLAENLKVTDERPPAVIVDIDETVLDNSPYQVDMASKGAIYDQATWLKWTNAAQASAVPGAVAFLKEAQAKGCTIFYITNRDVRERASTLKNLDSLTFPFADADHLLLMEGTSDKTERRARVVNSHHVVLLVGDQLRDFDERFKDRSVRNGKATVDALADTLSRYFVLLPNPMYGTYRDAVQGKGTDAEKQGNVKNWFRNNAH